MQYMIYIYLKELYYFGLEAVAYLRGPLGLGPSLVKKLVLTIGKK